MLTRGITLSTSSGLTAGLFNTPVAVGDIVIVEAHSGEVSSAKVLRHLHDETRYWSEHRQYVAEIKIMLKPCKIVTRSTATGLFFSALPNWQQVPMHAWFDALRARGVNTAGANPHVFRLHKNSQVHLVRGNYSAEQAALYVRAVGVDRIVEALVRSARQRKRLRRVDPGDGLPTAWCDDRMVPGKTVIVGGVLSDEHEALYGVPSEVVPLASNDHVLADKLLSLNHWVAESYALWISRPKGTSRAKWQRVAALKLVQALPVPADTYAMRHEPDASLTLYGDSVPAIQRTVQQLLPNGTRDAIWLAHRIEDAMMICIGQTCNFTLHALSDTRWGVTIGALARGFGEASFDVPAPREVLAHDYTMCSLCGALGRCECTYNGHSDGSSALNFSHTIAARRHLP